MARERENKGFTRREKNRAREGGKEKDKIAGDSGKKKGEGK